MTKWPSVNLTILFSCCCCCCTAFLYLGFQRPRHTEESVIKIYTADQSDSYSSSAHFPFPFFSFYLVSRTVPEDSLLSEHSQNNVSLGTGAPVNGLLGELLMVQTWILYSLEPSLHFGSFLKVEQHETSCQLIK